MLTTLRHQVDEQVTVLRRDRARQGVLIACVVGLVLRVAWVLYAARVPQGLFDPARYHGYALGIGEGKGLVEPLTGQPTAYFPPGYPWFLGVIQWVLVHTPLPDTALPTVAGLAQAVLGAASVAWVALLARRVHSPSAAVVAAAVMALYPNLVIHTAALLSETLAIALLLAALVALVPAGDAAWPASVAGRRVVAAGMLLGGLLLVRPVSGGVILAVGAAAALGRAGWRRSLGLTLALLAVAGLCVLPWTVRNIVRLDNATIVSTNTGDNLCIGHAPGATGAFRGGVPECQTGSGVQDGTEAEVRNDRIKTERGLRFMRESWAEQPRLVWRRFVVVVERDDDGIRAVQSYGADFWFGGDRTTAVRHLSDAAWYAVGLIGLAGWPLLARGRRGERLLIPLGALGLLASPLLTFGDARFKLPFVPLMIVSAAVAGVETARWLRSRSRPARP